MNRKIITSENLRRIFLQQAAGCCMALGIGAPARAQTMVTDTEVQATALGYKADAGNVDKSKQPKYAAGQLCHNCALYQGATGSASGGCPLFGRKHVAAKGWCSAWTRKG